MLTKDTKLRKRPLQQQALLSAGLRVFALTAANLTGEQQAAAFIAALKRISGYTMTAPISRRGGRSMNAL